MKIRLHQISEEASQSQWKDKEEDKEEEEALIEDEVAAEKDDTEEVTLSMEAVAALLYRVVNEMIVDVIDLAEVIVLVEADQEPAQH